MTLAPIDHIKDGVSKVVTQYQGKPKFLTYLAVFLDQVQKLEDQAQAVVDSFRLDTATGFRLDWIGRKVGQPRIGSSDDVYRTYIRGRIAANRSRGRIPDVIRVAALLLTNYQYEQFSTTIAIYSTDDMTQEMRQAAWSLLQSAAPAGVLVWLVQEPNTVFTFSQTAYASGSLCATTNTDGSPGAGDVLARVWDGVLS